MDKYNAWAEEYLGVVNQMWESGEYSQGYALLQNILREEPDYAKAHSMAGWYAQYQLKDRKLARKHYEWAILFDPSFAGTYYNYSEFLIEEKDLEALVALLTKGMEQPEVDKASLINDYARLLEIMGKYKLLASAKYKEAMKYTMNYWTMNTIKANRKRARAKYRLFSAIYSSLM